MATGTRPESRAEIWDAVAAAREAKGDVEGARRAAVCAQVNRDQAEMFSSR